MIDNLKTSPRNRVNIIICMNGRNEIHNIPARSIEDARQTGWFLGSPVVPKADFPNSMISFFCGGEDLGFVPMKGSKMSIVAKHGEPSGFGYRTYEYEYCFAKYLGFRMAKWMNKHCKRVSWVYGYGNIKQRFTGQGGPSVEKCFLENLKSGFLNAINYPTTKDELGYICEDDSLDIKWGNRYNNLLILCWLYGLNKEEQSTIKRLSMEATRYGLPPT